MSDRPGEDDALRDAEAVLGARPDPRPDSLGDPDPAPNGEAATPLPVLDVHADWGDPPPRRRWLVESYLPLGQPALFVGEGGSGKTKAALQLAHNMATNRPGEDRAWFGGGPAILEPGPVVFVSWEDERDELHRRLLTNPAYAHGGGAAALRDDLAGNLHAGNLHAVNMMGRGPLWEPGERGNGKPTDYGLAVQAHCEAAGAKLLIVDALDSAYADDENVRPRVRAFVSHWQAWGLRTGCTPLFIAHPAKAEGSNYSGSTAWRNAFRVMLIFAGKGDDLAKLTVDKINYGRKPEPVALRNWHWWHADTAPPPAGTTKADAEAEKAVTQFLAEAHPERQSQAAILANRGEISRRRMEDALIRMEAAGIVSMEAGARKAKMFGLPTATPVDDRPA